MSFKFNLKKRANGGFSVRMRSYSKEDKEAAGKPDVDYIEKTLPEHEWYRYGFSQDMTYAQASAHLKSLNSQDKIRQIQEKKARFKHVESLEKEELVASAYLPKAVVDGFEKKLKNDSYAENFEKSKTYFHWKTTMRVIAKIELAPAEWSDNKRTVLKQIEGYAPSTVSKLLSLMNAYGVFYCKKMGTFFEKVAMPKGPEIGRISDKYLSKTNGRTKEAKSLTLKQMDKLKESEDLTKEEINWCVVCLGLGLRPSETDEVAKRDPATLIIESKKVKVYQSKLVSLPKHMRFKEVSIKHQFQKDAVNILKSTKIIKKPSKYKIEKVLGDEYGLYSFRKSYVDIMLNLGEDITNISLDLGHSSIDRTWKSYRKRITKR